MLNIEIGIRIFGGVTEIFWKNEKTVTWKV